MDAPATMTCERCSIIVCRRVSGNGPVSGSSGSLQEAIGAARERTIPKEHRSHSTRSLALWDVLGTWIEVCEETDELKLSAIDQLEWISFVTQTDLRMNENANE